MSWKEELERILSPSTPQADREFLLRDLLARAPEISQELSEAVRTGSFSSLLPEDSELTSDLAMVQRQVMEDILPEVQALLDPGRLQENVQRAATQGSSVAQEAASSAPGAVASLLQDPARALGMLQQEARNMARRTPEGVETPPFRVLRVGDGYELREYPSFGVAVTPVQVQWDVATLAIGFNLLASYLLGANQRSESMEMTAPLRVDVLPSGSTEMSFPLPSKWSALTAPSPSDGRVSLRQTEGQTVAVSEFTGFATEGEVRRQLSALLKKLERDAVDMESSAYSVYQYNPPYTLPWLRRNELAVPVHLQSPSAPDDLDESAEAEPEVEGEESSSVDAAADDDNRDEEWEDLAPSD